MPAFRRCAWFRHRPRRTVHRPSSFDDLQMIVAIANQKGGVGKTTTAINLASALALRGKSTLLNRSRPPGQQHDLLRAAGGIHPYRVRGHGSTTAAPLTDVIRPSPQENLWIAPARIALAKLEARLVGELDAHFRLKERLDILGQRFSYIVIDCPPALGLLTVNALVASTHLLIPIQSSYFALEGTDDLLETVQRVQSRANPGLDILGVLITMHDRRTSLGRGHPAPDSRGVRRQGLPHRNLQERPPGGGAPAYRESIFTFAPNSTGAADYYSLCEEVMDRV